MRKAGVWILTIVGLLGLVTGLSFNMHGGGVSRAAPEGPTVVEPMVFRVGLPDAWIRYERRADGFSREVNLFRWSFGILVIGVIALYYAVVLARRTPKVPTNSPA
jgi:hypothetical protein